MGLLRFAAVCALAPLAAVSQELDDSGADAPADAWDAASSGGGSGAGGDSMMIADSAPDAFDRQRALRSANTQHQVMQQFLHNFARNMKYSVLADSAGDIPEAERQRMMQELRPDLASRQRMAEMNARAGGGDLGPTDEEISRQFPGAHGDAFRHRRAPPHRR